MHPALTESRDWRYPRGVLSLATSIELRYRPRWTLWRRSGGYASPDALIELQPAATLAELSRSTGVSRMTLAKLFAGGTANATGATLTVVARALRITVDKLIRTIDRHAAARAESRNDKRQPRLTLPSR